MVGVDSAVVEGIMGDVDDHDHDDVVVVVAVLSHDATVSGRWVGRWVDGAP